MDHGCQRACNSSQVVLSSNKCYFLLMDRAMGIRGQRTMSIFRLMPMKKNGLPHHLPRWLPQPHTQLHIGVIEIKGDGFASAHTKFARGFAPHHPKTIEFARASKQASPRQSRAASSRATEAIKGQPARRRSATSKEKCGSPSRPARASLL